MECEQICPGQKKASSIQVEGRKAKAEPEFQNDIS